MLILIINSSRNHVISPISLTDDRFFSPTRLIILVSSGALMFSISISCMCWFVLTPITLPRFYTMKIEKPVKAIPIDIEHYRTEQWV